MDIILNTNEMNRGKKWFEDDFQKSNKKRQRKMKINKKLKEAKLVGKIFVKGVINQATEPTTLMWAGAIGLIQGLKYKGNLKRGLISGTTTLGVFGVLNGVSNVKKYFDNKKQA